MISKNSYFLGFESRNPSNVHLETISISKAISFFRCSKHNSPTKSPSCSNGISSELVEKSQNINHKGKTHSHHHHVPRYKMRTAAEQEEIRKKTTNILEKTIAVLQLTALAQFGCGSEHFHKNTLKQTHKGNHYG